MESKIEINGIEISFKKEGTGPDIIFLHGIFASKEIMNPLFNHYKDKYHVISYDLRGHGESGKPEKFNLDNHADDLAAIVNYFNLKKPIVIGLSMGSYVALKTAEKYPDI